MKTKISLLLVGIAVLLMASVGQTWTRTGEDLGSRVAALEVQQAINTAQIATNTANIATNAANIATNTANIAANAANIATNTANIATNTTNIATNAANIAAHIADTGNAHSHDARYVRTSDTTERQISGALNPNGTIYSGTGFTSVRNSAGNYTITFSTPFTGNTRAVVDVFDGQHMDTQSLNNSSMTIQIRDPALTAVDESWDFVVFGR